MNLEPKLSKVDRIVSAVGGPGLIAYAFLGDLDKPALQILVIVFGIVVSINGFGGT